MESLTSLLGESTGSCPICSADSCTGAPHIQPISIQTFYGDPMAQEPLDTTEDGATAEPDDERAKHDEDRMKRNENR